MRSFHRRATSDATRFQRTVIATTANVMFVEPLEGRTLLTSVVVNEATDIMYPSISGMISLRNAMAIANASTTPTKITFDPSVFATPKTIVLNDPESIAGRLPFNGSQPLTITGPSARLTISNPAGQGTFYINDGNVTISNITTTGGYLNTSGGTLSLTNDTFINAGVSLDGQPEFSPVTATLNGVVITGAPLGGPVGISSGSTATIVNSAFVNNAGPISNAGVLKMAGVTIAGDKAGGQFADGGGQGGGLYNTGTATLIDDTFSGNSAVPGGAQPTSLYGGGAIFNDTTGTISLTNVTISGNRQAGGKGSAGAPGGGGILNNNPNAAKFTLANCIVAGNSADNLAPEIYGAVTSRGHNLIGQAGVGTNWTSTDLTGTAASPLNPLLGKLVNNGGSTPTLLPLAGSPAIDHGSNALLPSGLKVDQRGLPRIVNGTVDIGAVEVQASTQPASIKVTPPVAQSTIVNVVTSVHLGSFTQSNATGPFKVDIAWGDGSPDMILTVAAAGTIPAASHTFAKTGAFMVSEVVTDAKKNVSNKATFSETVVAAQATVSGKVFGDTNGDGKSDGTETGLAGWIVYVDANKNGQFDPTEQYAITNSNGNYTLTLKPGTYTIGVEVRAGYYETAPHTIFYNVTVAAGQTITGDVFGMKAISPV